MADNDNKDVYFFVCMCTVQLFSVGNAVLGHVHTGVTCIQSVSSTIDIHGHILVSVCCRHVFECSVACCMTCSIECFMPHGRPYCTFGFSHNFGQF